MRQTRGIRDWGSGIRAATGITLMLAMLTPCSLCALRPLTRRSGRPSRTRPASPPNPADVAVPPIECWWKTDRSAVTIGENFQLTLTCAVLATERVSGRDR